MSILVLAIATMIPVSSNLATSSTGSSSASHHLVSFTSYQELQQFLSVKSCPPRPLNTSTDPVPLTGKSSDQLSASPGASSGPGYSQTNDQVPGVDELDNVKTDGQYIYAVTNSFVPVAGANYNIPSSAVAIVLPYPSNLAKSVALIHLNGSVQGLFASGSRLVIVTQEPYYALGILGEAVYPSGSMPVGMWAVQPPTTSLQIFDISNPSKPTLTTSLVVNGTLAGARLIGNYVYLIATHPVYCDRPVSLPEIKVGSSVVESTVSQVYHLGAPEICYGCLPSYSFTSIVSVNVSHGNPDPTLKILLLESSNTMYVAPHDIFLTQPLWNQNEATVVHRVHIDLGKIDYQATGIVPGHVFNQFSMDQYNGYLRIATVDSPIVALMGRPASAPVIRASQQTNLYVMDNALNIYGKLEGIAPGESFYSARFMGDKAYLVTYLRIDPLFVVSLQDPSQPRILGELRTSGVSSYLQPYDNTHLIGLGSDRTMKLSLFDVSDPNRPTETSKYLFESGSYSTALYEHKAVLFDRALDLLVIPVSIYNNTSVWQGAYVFKVSIGNGIVFRGGITHETISYAEYRDSTVSRSLYIGNTLYTISGSMVKLNSLTDLSEIGSVQLAP